jgi:AP-3 complex subunit mu
LATDIHTT